MLHVGLDLSRKRLDVHVLDETGKTIEVTAVLPDRDGLRSLARRLESRGQPVRAAVESMTGARFVHDELEMCGWEVDVADAQRVKGLAPLACKTDKIDARVLAELCWRDLVPAIWLPTPDVRGERERARWRLHLVRHRAALKCRIHSTLITFGHQCPVSDLFGRDGRALLDRLDLPEASIRSVADDGPGRWMDPGLNDRIGDRRHRSLLVPEGFVRVHRSLPPRLPIRQQGPARVAGQERPSVSPLGPHRGKHPCGSAPGIPRSLRGHQEAARQATRSQSGPHRGGPQADRINLVHALPQPGVFSGRPPKLFGRMTAPF